MALQTNKVKVQKIDMNRPSYNKAASGENGLDAIIKNSVSYTNANQALKIYKAFLKTYEFNASSYDIPSVPTNALVEQSPVFLPFGFTFFST